MPNASKLPLTFDSFRSRYKTASLADSITESFTLASQREPRLNAFITFSQESALAKARSLETDDSLLPLKGIPYAVKDLIDVVGLATTCGSLASSTEPASKSAPVVERLDAAGAILIGKTNLLEYAYGAVHPEVGATRNPWNTARTAGGSSGGSAAAVAAGICPLALGSDTGGSIRIPAAYCGVVGFKPSLGLVPVEGVTPLAYSLDHVGPITQSCYDAREALTVLARQTFPSGKPLHRTTVGVPQTYLEAVSVQAGVAAAFDDFINIVQTAGVTLKTVAVHDLEQANTALLELLYPEASVIHKQNMQGRKELYGPETWRQLKDGFTYAAVQYIEAQRFQRTFTDRLRATFSEIDFLVMPTVPWVAPAEDPAVSGGEGATEMHFTGPFNLSGSPALSLPWGTAENLPVGLQIVANTGCDGELLGFGELLETLAPRLGIPPLQIKTVD